MGQKSKTFDSSALANGSTGLSTRMARIKLTDQEKKRLQEVIKKATSLDEITKLESMLREGRIPPGVHLSDATEE